MILIHSHQPQNDTSGSGDVSVGDVIPPSIYRNAPRVNNGTTPGGMLYWSGGGVYRWRKRLHQQLRVTRRDQTDCGVRAYTNSWVICFALKPTQIQIGVSQQEWFKEERRIWGTGAYLCPMLTATGIFEGGLRCPILASEFRYNKRHARTARVSRG